MYIIYYNYIRFGKERLVSYLPMSHVAGTDFSFRLVKKTVPNFGFTNIISLTLAILS